jgi:hypothetical protein
MTGHANLGVAVVCQDDGLSCTVCAPNAMPRAAVVAMANVAMPGPRAWRIVDKGDIIFVGGAQSRPCPDDPTQRQHFFLIRGENVMGEA